MATKKQKREAGIIKAAQDLADLQAIRAGVLANAEAQRKAKAKKAKDAARDKKTLEIVREIGEKRNYPELAKGASWFGRGDHLDLTDMERHERSLRAAETDGATFAQAYMDTRN